MGIQNKNVLLDRVRSLEKTVDPIPKQIEILQQDCHGAWVQLDKLQKAVTEIQDNIMILLKKINEKGG